MGMCMGMEMSVCGNVVMCDRYCLQEKFEAFLKELERERQLKIEEVMVAVCRTWCVYCNGVYTLTF